VPQLYQNPGNVNRLVASISWANFSGLTVTAPSLDKGGIDLTFSGGATGELDAMTGVVLSPEPYQKCNFTAHVLKTQPLAGLFQAQLQLSALLGPCTIRPDLGAGGQGLQPYSIQNSAIQTVNTITMNGTTAGYDLVFTGTYYINTSSYP
jgi:hypothetical protein